MSSGSDIIVVPLSISREPMPPEATGAGLAVDKSGNIGIGYSYGGATQFAGQRFSGRLAGDSLGVMSFAEGIFAEGRSAQTNTLRWEDYTYTALDPSDDETFWYVGDYLKEGAKNYSTKIGAFRLNAPAAGNK